TPPKTPSPPPTTTATTESTPSTCRQPAAMRHLPFAQEHHAPISNIFKKSAVTEYCPNHGTWPKNFVIPAKAGI
ncbi:TPA: hypothetical protein ACLBIR_002159, partial [Neisseria meningitidis]